MKILAIAFSLSGKFVFYQTKLLCYADFFNILTSPKFRYLWSGKFEKQSEICLLKICNSGNIILTFYGGRGG